MGKLRKIGRKVKRGFSKVGKRLKKGLGKIAKAFGKLGPLGSIALSFILPGMGSVLSGWLSNMGPVGEFILGIGNKIQQGANWVKDGVGRVFNRATDAIEYGMNKVSSIGGQGTAGSDFRNWVSKQTKGFIDPSTKGVEDITVPGSTKTITKPIGKDMTGPSQQFTVEVPETTISAEAQMGIGGPKIPQTPKGMTDPVYMDGLDTDLKKGFYEQADLDKYYTGVDQTLTMERNYPGVIRDPLPKEVLKDNQVTIKGVNATSVKGDLKAPKPQGSGYFSKVKKSYKVLGPAQALGGKMLADESDAAYSDYLMRVNNAARAGAIAEETLSVVPTNTYAYAPQEFININNLDNDSAGMQRLTAGYGMILEDTYAT